MAETPKEEAPKVPAGNDATAVRKALFAIRKSVRYHDRRTAFFEILHRVTDLFTILLAGVVIMELIGDAKSPLTIKVFAAIGAVLAAVDLVVGFAKSADLHRTLKRRFIQLEQKCLTASSADLLQSDRLGIEGDEPPVFRALDVLCIRELAIAQGHTVDTYAVAFWPMPFYMRITAHVWYWNGASTRAQKWASKQKKPEPKQA